MGYATISLFRNLTNMQKNLVDEPTLKAIFPIADRLINKQIATKVYREQLHGNINGTNKFFRTIFAPIADSTLKNTILLDNANTADWTDSTDASADSLVGALVLPSSALALGKDGTASASATYTKTKASTVDGTGRRLRVSVLITEIKELAKDLALTLRVGNVDTDYFSIDFKREDLRNGINELNIEISEMGQTGTPDITTLDYMFIGFNTEASADLITSGDIIMDHWRIEDIDSPDTSDVQVFYATQDSENDLIFGSAQAITGILADEGRIEMTTAPTTTTAKNGVWADYLFVSRDMDWNLINSASCYLAAHLASFKISGDSPNYGQIQDAFARRDLAGAPDEWLRLALSMVINAIGEAEDGIGFRRIEADGGEPTTFANPDEHKHSKFIPRGVF